MKYKGFLLAVSLVCFMIGSLSLGIDARAREGDKPPQKLTKTEAEWRQILTPEQFRIMRKKGTERAYSGKYYDYKDQGIYVCVGCGNELFSSRAKYDSKTGWPSFYQPISGKNIYTAPDNTLFTRRTEVLCYRCDAHLGHVFKDGPPPTNLRYCINSITLKFVPE